MEILHIFSPVMKLFVENIYKHDGAIKISKFTRYQNGITALWSHTCHRFDALQVARFRARRKLLERK